jgi:hypothetical protein
VQTQTGLARGVKQNVRGADRAAAARCVRMPPLRTTRRCPRTVLWAEVKEHFRRFAPDCPGYGFLRAIGALKAGRNAFAFLGSEDAPAITLEFPDERASRLGCLRRLLRTTSEPADRPRTGFCFALAEQSSEDAHSDARASSKASAAWLCCTRSLLS